MSKNSAPIPTVLAMLVCDQVIAEQGTGKKSLIGIFDNVNGQAFPAQVRLAVYAKLADAEGDYTFRLTLVNLKNETHLIDMNIKATVADPLSAVELAVNMIGFVLPEAGRYEFQLWYEDTFLHRITLNARIQGGPTWQPPSRSQ